MIRLPVDRRRKADSEVGLLLRNRQGVSMLSSEASGSNQWVS